MKPKTFAALYEEAEKHDDYWVAGVVQELTEEIAALMEKQGVTRSELARRLGTSPAYVTKILRGNANFTLTTMVKLARALGTDLQIKLDPTARKPVQSERRPRKGGRDERRRPGLAATPAVPSA